MSLHDKLALKAMQTGKSSQEFHAAAQKHANAAWFFLVAAGVAWYFKGWAWAAIPILICAFTGFQSVSSTLVATRLKNLKK